MVGYFSTIHVHPHVDSKRLVVRVMKGAGQIKKKQFTYFMPSHNVYFESLRTRSAVHILTKSLIEGSYTFPYINE